jgi:hypothetical protein
MCYRYEQKVHFKQLKSKIKRQIAQYNTTPRSPMWAGLRARESKIMHLFAETRHLSASLQILQFLVAKIGI